MHFFDISASKSAPKPSVFYTFDFDISFVPQRRTLFRHDNFQKCSEPLSFFFTFDFEMCLVPQRRALFRHDNFQKCSDPLSIFSLLTSKCASCHNGERFFNMTTSKSVPNPNPSVFFSLLTSKRALCHNGVHFFDMSTSKRGPDMVCFVRFDLESASRHNGMQLFISHLTTWLTWLRTRRFSEPTFCPSGTTMEKQSESRLFCLFARLHLLSS